MQQPTDMLSVLTALPLFAGCPAGCTRKGAAAGLPDGNV